MHILNKSFLGASLLLIVALGVVLLFGTLAADRQESMNDDVVGAGYPVSSVGGGETTTSYSYNLVEKCRWRENHWFLAGGFALTSMCASGERVLQGTCGFTNQAVATEGLVQVYDSYFYSTFEGREGWICSGKYTSSPSVPYPGNITINALCCTP